MRICWACFVGLGLAIVVGCNVSHEPTLVPVGGVVTLDGKPLSGVTVMFFPKGSTRGSGAFGITDEAGKYELTDRLGGKGAPIGEYQIVINKFGVSGDSKSPVGSGTAAIESPARQILPDRYNSRDRTVLTATVRDDFNAIDFPLSTR